MGMARGELRIYLGAAAGVGKTFAMLNEGRRRRDYGEDVVVGFVETHGRQKTAEQVGDLEVVPRTRFEYRDTTFEEMNVDAILERYDAERLRVCDEGIREGMVLAAATAGIEWRDRLSTLVVGWEDGARTA